MTSLESILEKLGLSEYLQVLVEEGFSKWETVCDITESDLSALGFKRGHRRILQREIASFRGISPSRKNSPQIGLYSEESVESQEGGSRQDQKSGKRKYRHHPKADENAPEKPPSAYVMFANELKDKSDTAYSFTEIARMVGDRWKGLPVEQRSAYETQASNMKDQYNADFASYKKTDKFREYQDYVVQFRLKYPKEPTAKALASVEPVLPSDVDAVRKRPKLENMSSTGSNESSISATSGIGQDYPLSMGRIRGESGIATSSLSPASAMGQPGSFVQGSAVPPYGPHSGPPYPDQQYRPALKDEPPQRSPVHSEEGSIGSRGQAFAGTPRSILTSVSSGSAPPLFTASSQGSDSQRSLRSLPFPTPPSAGSSYYNEPSRAWQQQAPSQTQNVHSGSSWQMRGGPGAELHHPTPGGEAQSPAGYFPPAQYVDPAGGSSASRSGETISPPLASPQKGSSAGQPPSAGPPKPSQGAVAPQPFSILLEAGESLARGESIPPRKDEQ